MTSIKKSAFDEFEGTEEVRKDTRYGKKMPIEQLEGNEEFRKDMKSGKRETFEKIVCTFGVIL